MHDDPVISDGYFDVEGDWHVTSESTRERIRQSIGTPRPGSPMWFVPAGTTHRLWGPCRIVLEDGADLGGTDSIPGDLPIGYHDLIPFDGGPATRLVVHPTACPALPRAWGAAVQTYALWSRRSWGIGDLGDLAALASSLRSAGGSVLLVSPLHQPAPTAHQQDSPYYPSSRRAWNPMLLALDTPVPPALACNATGLIDRDAVWAAKRPALEAMFDNAERAALEPPRPVAVWNALCDMYGTEWTTWPDDVRSFDPAALSSRLGDDEALARRAAFHQWCQQRIGEQLADVAATGVSVVGDLAIGFSPVGADAWEYQSVIAPDMRIGAPPDPFNRGGQEWGIPPFVPWRLRAARYQPFIDTIRAALTGVQGLRIDHVMGLFRQFWIPSGECPTQGAYVNFPADDLLAIICLEAARANAFVVGEDLGTVAAGVRAALATRHIAGTRVLWFEQDPPSTWPAASLATVTTHDLPTIAGVLTGTDGDDEQRRRLRAVVGEPDESESALTVPEAIARAHDALLHSPASLRLVSMDDVTGALERPNFPGTVDQPNWRRRLPVSVDNITVER